MDLVSFGKAFSDPTRVRILHALVHSDLCVCEMVDSLEIGQSTLSMHLQTIRQAGIVETTRRHKMVTYALADSARPLVETLFEAHRPSLDADRRIARDLARVRERIGLRRGGVCYLGPGQLDRSEDSKK